MNKPTILALVARLKEAGQQHIPHGAGSPWDRERAHNARVDAAAAALVAEIGQLPEFDCAKCARTECPHSGSCPARPGPPHGCSSFKGGPT